MAKITLNDLTTNYGSQTLHNTNNGEIESHLNNKVLYRDNPEGEPNQMENALDMNSNDILNGKNASFSQITVDGQILSPNGTGVTALPSQTGQDGKVLSTTGGSAIWEDKELEYFDTVAAMKLSSLESGRMVATKGYYTAGDGGGATYMISPNQAVDGYGDHLLASGNVALLQEPVLYDRFFGVVRDDSTENLNAAQAAITYAANSGKRLLLSDGVARVTGTLTVPAIGASMIGQGMENSTFRQMDGASICIRTDPALTRNFSGLLEDFQVIMPDNATAAAIQINNPNGRHELNRIKIQMEPGERSDGIGIHVIRTSGDALVDGYFTTIRNCFVNKYAEGIRIEGQNPGGAALHWIDQTTVTDCATYGMHFLNTSAVRVDACHIEINNKGIYSENSSDLRVNRCYFERNDVYDWHHVSGDACFASDNRFAASGVGSASGRAIYMEDTNFSEIVHNWFFESFTSFDIELLANCNGVFIADNVTKLRDVAGGWGSNGPRVSDNGVGTTIKNPQRTSGGTYQYNYSKGNFVLNGSTGISFSGGSNVPSILAGDGSPEGVITASRGSIFLRTDGAAGFTFYVKESGDGTNTGWGAK